VSSSPLLRSLPSASPPQVFQAYDFYHLYKTHNCKVQLGGSDQWGNITAGTDLIRRLSPTTNTPGEEGDAFGITLPLLTTKGGVKFGKSAGNAIWLSADLTSPYELYQYLLQTADDEIHARMLQLTLLTTTEIDQVLAQHHSEPGARLAQRSLAREVRRLKLSLFAHCVATAKLKGGRKRSRPSSPLSNPFHLKVVFVAHGERGVREAELCTDLLHGQRTVASFGSELAGIWNKVPHVEVERSLLSENEGMTIAGPRT
jgi:hypothetical protein